MCAYHGIHRFDSLFCDFFKDNFFFILDCLISKMSVLERIIESTIHWLIFLIYSPFKNVHFSRCKLFSLSPFLPRFSRASPRFISNIIALS